MQKLKGLRNIRDIKYDRNYTKLAVAQETPFIVKIQILHCVINLMYGKDFDIRQQRAEAKHKEYIQRKLKRMLFRRKMEL